MLTERIRKIKELEDDFERLTTCVPLQHVKYTPDPDASVMERLLGAVEAVLDQCKTVHMPGSRLAGCGGYQFIPKPEFHIPSDEEAIKNFPASCRQEIVDAIDEGIFGIFPAMFGHVCVDNVTFIYTGVNGMIRRLQERAKDESLTERQQEFLRTAIREWEAVLRLEKRYEVFYRELEAKETDPVQKKEYAEIADRIARVPAQPAEHFVDALQSMWFMYMCLHAEDQGGHTIGRLDQTLYPFYKKDLEEGILTKEEAEEYFQDFWLKFNMSHTVLETCGERTWNPAEKYEGASDGRTWMSTRCVRDQHVDDGFVVDIGGMDVNGNDAVNEISWMILRTLSETKALGVKPVAKFSRCTSQEFKDACYKVIMEGNGLPALSYDENAIEAFRNEPENNYTEEDLINICHIGCIELAVPYKSYTDPMNAFMNLPKIFAITMNNGYLNGKKLGLELPEADTFDQLKENYRRQIEYFVDLYVEGTNKAVPFYNQYYCRPMVSSLMGGCIESATLIDEGGSTFWVKSMNSCGTATAADCMMAVKKVVYDDHRKSMKEFVDILEKDYEGEEDFRQYLLNRIPKYGNGIDEVDQLAKFVAEGYCDIVSKKRTFNGHVFRPGTYSYYGTVINLGEMTPALPNGRHAGGPLSFNIVPDHGMAHSGLGGILHSVSAIDHRKALNAATVDVQLTANTPIEVIRYIDEYVGSHTATVTQITMANREDMIAAQKNPEKYKDLVVRVTGFSARFIALDRQVQDEIINRCYWA